MNTITVLNLGTQGYPSLLTNPKLTWRYSNSSKSKMKPGTLYKSNSLQKNSKRKWATWPWRTNLLRARDLIFNNNSKSSNSNSSKWDSPKVFLNMDKSLKCPSLGKLSPKFPRCSSPNKFSLNNFLVMTTMEETSRTNKLVEKEVRIGSKRIIWMEVITTTLICKDLHRCPRQLNQLSRVLLRPL